ncbi:MULTISPECIES: family 3 encapsulin nanocompartment shell protein [unclassified Nocardia]|uniref:family 3 encapsulin nanocompartment shell protein n=1 Tax=unclassified Nocardia TaxID=2637762 RepID=UPI001CE45304|nr:MULTISPECIES: family 3 encapsulin nanocompartment shell protein [unclassified Nocardia]
MPVYTSNEPYPIGSDSRIVGDDTRGSDISPAKDFATHATAGAAGNSGYRRSYSTYLPDYFPLLGTRRRFMVRHLIKMVRVDSGHDGYYLREPLSREEREPIGIGRSGTSYQSTPEAAFGAVAERTGFSRVAVSLPVPADITRHVAELEQFISYRMFVRMWTRENELLLYGDTDAGLPGLLTTEGLREARTADLVSGLFATAAVVEETGGSCDGIVLHTETYWQASESNYLDRLRDAGVTVSRTRMIPRDQALLGDFRAGATIYDPGDSAIALSAADPAGRTRDLTVVSRVGLAVHVPQHFVLLKQEG